MLDISKIDKNFAINTNIENEDIQFYNVDERPFKIYGIFKENGKYRRMPEKIAKEVSSGVYALHTHTAGGRIRFKTDSPYIAVNVQMDGIGRMTHFPLTGSAGLDFYVREDGMEKYSGTFKPPYDMKDGFEDLIYFKNNKYAQPTRKMREITVNLPPYSEIKDLYIGIENGAVLEEPSPYVNEKPIVYYGHSITQGGCVSRPGYAYPCILSRRFHYDFLNLGFSGSAKGDEKIAEYIAGLDAQMLVYDYDHNAPDVDFLRNTHEKMFKIIRAAKPDLPVIMLTTTPKLYYLGENEERKQVVYQTYMNAVNAGDKNVYFLDGSKVCDECIDGPVGATVEGSHLNDLGFTYLAKALGDLMEKIR